MNIVIEFTDGTQETIVSDRSWKFSTGPIVFNCVRGGEIQDARKEKPNWNLAGYDDSDWKYAKEVPSPDGKLVSQQHPPIRANKVISPISLTEPAPGIYVYDLGVNMAGWARIKVEGNPGDTVVLFYNEHLNPDSTVRFGPHSWWHYGPYQTEKFILKGEGREVFEPKFTYHGFRYIQVTGLKKKPKLNDLEAIWAHTDVYPAGKFSCSNQYINKVQDLILRTQLNNLHGIPTDCPHREKIAWMGDGLITMEEAIFNFNMAAFYVKWFNDMLDAQESDGHVPPIVPNSGWDRATSSKNPKDVIPDFSDPWWGGALLLTPWKIYLFYGDRRYLEKGYEAMKLYVDWIGSRANDYIFVANLGDWIEPAFFSDAKITPKEQIGTATYFHFVKVLSKTAELLNKPADAQKYAILSEKIRKRFNEEFFDPESGLYAEDSQLAQVFPLLFGLVPEGKEKLVENRLIDNIKNIKTT